MYLLQYFYDGFVVMVTRRLLTLNDTVHASCCHENGYSDYARTHARTYTFIHKYMQTHTHTHTHAQRENNPDVVEIY